MIPFSKPTYYGNEVEYVNDAVKSTWISHGYYVDKFEEMLGEKLDSEHVLATSNGTSALMLAYLTLGLKAGDEIIVPGYCFQAAANVALQLGIKPVFADILYGSLNINFTDIAQKITNRTKAIVVVNNYGNVSNIRLLKTLTNLPIIEDCAESIFSEYDSYFCGTLADIGTFSFHATKTITTGEGGAVAVKNPLLASKARLLINHGLETRGTYNHKLPGNNFRMTNLQAALGVAQLEYVDRIIDKKVEIFETYKKLFFGSGVLSSQLYFPETSPVIWSYAVVLDKIFRKNTNNIIDDLKKNFGIETRPGFVPPNLLTYFISNKKDIPISNEMYDRIIVLPSHTCLVKEEIKYIADSLLRTIIKWK